MYFDSHTHHYLFDLRDNYIYKNMVAIRKNPVLWIGKKSLSALYLYIKGCYETYMDVNPGQPDWIIEFYQYVCDICVNGNGAYGPEKAIFACGYDDETGFDYFYSLLDEYTKDHAVVNDMDMPEEVLQLKNEIRMIYIDWRQIPGIVKEYVAKNANRLFRLLENERAEKYKSCSMPEMSHDGIVFAISDEWNKVSEQMEEFVESCKGKNQGICYKVVKFDEENE